MDDRYFKCSKMGTIKVSRCNDMREGEHRRTECRGCTVHTTLTLENTFDGTQLESKAMSDAEKNPERKIEELFHLGRHLQWLGRSRRGYRG